MPSFTRPEDQAVSADDSVAPVSAVADWRRRLRELAAVASRAAEGAPDLAAARHAADHLGAAWRATAIFA
jgi:hypothetical protein